MFLRSLRAECLKLRHSPIWLAFFLLPIVPAFMGTFNYLQNLSILQDGWYSLWTQHTLFTCYFFFPALIGVYCSYLFRLEHSHQNWITTMSLPVPVSYIYIAKLVMVSIIVAFTQVWIGILFILAGKLVGLASPIPPELLSWLFFGIIGGIVTSALQLAISMVIRSFAVPVGVALIGGIASIGIMAKGYGLWFPYSLISLGMYANSPSSTEPLNAVPFLVSSMIYLFALSIFSILWLNLRDVTTR